MVKCWASVLGECSRKASREHFISQSLVDGEFVTIQGLHWCHAIPVRIGLSSACAHLLCKHHNETLSPLDKEMGRLKHALRSAFTALPPGAAPGGEWRVDQQRVFRWLSKAYCNLEALYGRTSREEFVRHAFGLVHAPRVHVYLAHWKGQEFGVNFGHLLHYGPFWSDTGERGAVIALFGFTFVVTNFGPTPAQQRAMAMVNNRVPEAEPLLESPGFVAFGAGNPPSWETLRRVILVKPKH
jgi:hypothetical protein